MPVASPKKKRSLVALLIVVFLASYGLMTLLIVEQNAAIQQQHNLIQVLLSDSRELWAMKGKILTANSAPGQAHAQSSTQTPLTHGQAPSVQTPTTQTQSTQAQSTQTPSTQTPSTQAPQHHAQSRAGKAAKPETQLPPMPASDLGDHRRVLISL
jgi:cytoskeletal protein RodZ